MNKVIKLVAKRIARDGDKRYWMYFVDPETGRLYLPNEDFKVTATGETDLRDLFIEVASAKWNVEGEQ